MNGLGLPHEPLARRKKWAWTAPFVAAVLGLGAMWWEKGATLDAYVWPTFWCTTAVIACGWILQMIVRQVVLPWFAVALTPFLAYQATNWVSGLFYGWMQGILLYCGTPLVVIIGAGLLRDPARRQAGAWMFFVGVAFYACVLASGYALSKTPH